MGLAVTGSTISKFVYPNAEGMLSWTFGGELVFARHGRHLVMLSDTPDEVGTVWCAFEATIRNSGGTLVVESLALGRTASSGPDPDVPGDGVVTGEILRAVRLEGIVNVARRYIRTNQANIKTRAEQPHLSEFMQAWAPQWQRRLSEGVELLDGIEQKPHAGGRPSLPDEHFRRIALRCLALQEEGNSRGAHKTIATEEDRNPKTVADWIRKARHLGFLAPGKPGIANFAPGPRLLADGSDHASTKPQRRRNNG